MIRSMRHIEGRVAIHLSLQQIADTQNDLLGSLRVATDVDDVLEESGHVGASTISAQLSNQFRFALLLRLEVSERLGCTGLHESYVMSPYSSTAIRSEEAIMYLHEAVRILHGRETCGATRPASLRCKPVRK